MTGLQAPRLVYWRGWTTRGKTSCEGAQRRDLLLDALLHLYRLQCFQHSSEHTDFNRNPKYKTHRPWWAHINLSPCSACFLLTASPGSTQKLTGAETWVYTCHKGNDSWPRTLDVNLNSVSKSDTLQGLCLQNYLQFSCPWSDPKPSWLGRISSDSGLNPVQAGNNRKTGYAEAHEKKLIAKDSVNIFPALSKSSGTNRNS